MSSDQEQKNKAEKQTAEKFWIKRIFWNKSQTRKQLWFYLTVEKNGIKIQT